MATFHYDSDYPATLLTGTALAARLAQEGKAEIEFVITGIRKQRFDDGKSEQWVLALGDGLELRVKPQIGSALIPVFGKDGAKWVGRSIALSAEYKEWTDRDSGEAKSGTTIVARPLPLNSYATATGNGQLAAVFAVTPPPSLKRELDDDIPF